MKRYTYWGAERREETYAVTTWVVETFSGYFTRVRRAHEHTRVALSVKHASHWPCEVMDHDANGATESLQLMHNWEKQAELGKIENCG